MSKPAPQRNHLTNELKVKICEQHIRVPNMTQSELGKWAMEEFKLGAPVPQKTISNILSRADKLYQLVEQKKGKLKNGRDVKFPGLDEDIENFIVDMNSKNQPVNRASIMLYARLMARKKYKMNELPEKDRIRFSDGWLTKVLHRIDAKSRKLHGEAASVDLTSENIVQQLKKIEELLKDYQPKDIYNFDETGLYYEQQPTRTICKKSTGGAKKSKNRLTVGLLANSDGSDKGHPIVIGSRKNPRGSTKKESLLSKMVFGADRVEYHHNASAWMNSSIFKQYITKLSRKFEREGRHVAILLDNASVHKIKETFSHIQLIFLPANTTSKLQPLDAGTLLKYCIL